MQKVRTMPEQAYVIANYMLYMADFIQEKNYPEQQIHHLEEIMSSFRESPLPQSREEFESRAMLYHIMMDLEDFLKFKSRFISELNEQQLQIYWRNDMENAEK